MYKITIGLEIHVKLNTPNKLFCRCANVQDFIDLEPNTNICPVCTAQPGALPTVSQECIDLALRLGNLLNCEHSNPSSRDRKNYFYPDLPMGYQITQLHHPINKNGVFEYYVNNYQTARKVQIQQAHLENDTAKSIHAEGVTLIDRNRSGTPLVEIVTGPDFHSGEEVVDFLKQLQKSLQRNNISSAELDKGQMRVDVNISISDTDKLGTRVEIKNINSYSAILAAINYEYNRHIQTLSSGGEIQQATVRRDDSLGQTVLMRSKENAHDYRYFPEPDIRPINIGSDKGAYFEKKDGKIILTVPYQDRPKIGLENKITKTIGIIIKHPNDDKYILAYHKKSNWVLFPGGGIEEGEIPAEAARREMIEETGYYDFDDDNIYIIGNYDVSFSHADKNANYINNDTIVFIQLKSLNQKQISEIEENKHQITWIEKDNIINKLTGGGHKFMFNRVQNNKDNGNYDKIDKEFMSHFNQSENISDIPKSGNNIYISEVLGSMIELGFNKEYINGLIQNKDIYTYRQEVVNQGQDAKIAAKWICGSLLGYCAKANLEGDIYNCPHIDQNKFVQFLVDIAKYDLNDSNAKAVLDDMYDIGITSTQSISDRGFDQVADIDYDDIAKHIVDNNPSIVEQYRGGKTTTMGFFLGQFMKITGGKSKPDLATQAMEKILNG